MSNQLPTTMTQGNFALPAHLQQKEARVASAGSEYLPYISLRNGQFVPMMGKEAMAPLPVPLNVIILDFQQDVGRVFYDGAYDPSKTNVTPDCWSVDGKTPDENAPKRQAPGCSTCPQNAKGSAMNGRAKACSYSRRIVVMVPGYDTPFMLKLGGMSLFGEANAQSNEFTFQNYAKQLQSGFGQPVDPSWVWTQIKFDPRASVPALRFAFGADANNNNTFLNPDQIALVEQVQAQHHAQIQETIAGTYTARSSDAADGATATDANGGAAAQNFAQQPMANPVTHASQAQPASAATTFAAQPINSMHQPPAADPAPQTTQPDAFAAAQQQAGAAGVMAAGTAGFNAQPQMDQNAVGAVEAGQVAATELVQPTQPAQPAQTQDVQPAQASQPAQPAQADAGATNQGVLGVLAQLDQTAQNATS